MELPKNEEQIEIDIIGDTTFKKYQGQFTIRCVLSAGQRHSMELEKSRLMGMSPQPTDALVGLAEVLGTLRAKVVEAPEWWKQSLGGSQLNDENVLMELYNKIGEAEIEWRNKVKKMANPTPQPADSNSPNT
jgi:hypothetical protein